MKSQFTKSQFVKSQPHETPHTPQLSINERVAAHLGKKDRRTMSQVQAEVDLEAIRTIIRQLQVELPKVRSVIVARNDGLPLVQTVSRGDATKVAAMTATAISLNKRIINTIEAGDLTETSISGSAGADSPLRSRTTRGLGPDRRQQS